VIYPIIYIFALVAANLLVATIGPWFSVVNSFILIGLDLTLRDKLHDKWDGNPLKIGGLIAVAGAVSYLFNPASSQIAIASVVAFTLSMMADSFVYQKLKNQSWEKRATGSNLAGAAIDSLFFPTIAFGGLMPEIVAMQFASKIVGGFLWTKLLKNKGENNG
jgi:queuosine precursor transporter